MKSAGELGMQDKIVVTDWNNCERMDVLELVQFAINKTRLELMSTNDPRISNRLEFRIADLEIQRDALKFADAYFLENNRANFSEFVI